MLGFLQGFAYGLWLSCLPWFIAGLINPHIALPTASPRRWQLFLRYWLAIPFLAFLLWLTSLWGGFGPSLAGWLTGLVAIPAGLFVERRWRRWQAAWVARRAAVDRQAGQEQARAEAERRAREARLRVLDPDHPPAGADDTVRALCRIKRALQEQGRRDLALQADRLYSRYTHVVSVLHGRFDAEEMAFRRALGLVREVTGSAIERLERAVSLVAGAAPIDTNFVRRRLAETSLDAGERRALERRLALAEDAERQVREAVAANEAALTALDDAAVSVSRIDTGPSRRAQAAEEALKELHRFAARASQYEERP